MFDGLSTNGMRQRAGWGCRGIRAERGAWFDRLSTNGMKPRAGWGCRGIKGERSACFDGLSTNGMMPRENWGCHEIRSGAVNLAICRTFDTSEALAFRRSSGRSSRLERKAYVWEVSAWHGCSRRGTGLRAVY